jgi:hypothetical protein
MASPTNEKTDKPTNTGTTDESVRAQAVAPDPAQPAHPMPEHFPEVTLDDDTGAVRIAGPATQNKQDKPAEPAKDAGATIAAAPAATTVTPTPPVVRPAPAAIPYAPADTQNVQPNYTGYQAERNVCVRCGSTNLSRGYVVDYSDQFRQLHFATRRMSTRRLNWAIRPYRSLTQLNAVACRDCGAVLLVADPHELRKSERRRRDD